MKKETYKNQTGIICFDTETTGIDKEQDELLELAIVDGNGKILFNSYLKPERTESWEKAAAVNGITPEMVKDAPTLQSVLPKIKEIFQAADIVVGYNTRFDLAFLNQAGVREKDGAIIKDVMLDFAPIYGDWNEQYGTFRWQKLTTCADYYNFDWNSTGSHAHDALADTLATLYCYNKVEEEKAKEKEDDLSL